VPHSTDVETEAHRLLTSDRVIGTGIEPALPGLKASCKPGMNE
jgi:hypothetical protein